MKIDIRGYLAEAKKRVEEGGNFKELPAGPYGCLEVTSVLVKDFGRGESLIFRVKDATGKAEGSASMRVSPYGDSEKQQTFAMEWIAQLAVAGQRTNINDAQQLVGVRFAGVVKYKTYVKNDGSQGKESSVFVNGYPEDSGDVSSQSIGTGNDQVPNFDDELSSNEQTLTRRADEPPPVQAIPPRQQRRQTAPPPADFDDDIPF